MQLNRGLLGGSENLFNYTGSDTATNQGVTGVLNGSYLKLSGTNVGAGGFINTEIPLNIPAGTYTIKYYGIDRNKGFAFNFYDADGNTLVDVGYVTELTFTIASPIKKLNIWVTSNSASYDDDVYIMLNAGSTALPYKAFSGNIVFEADLEPTLLWETSSSGGSYSGGTITVSDMSNYKYLIIEYKNLDSETALNVKKVVKVLNSSDYYIGEIMGVSGSTTDYALITRAFAITDTTTITIGSARYVLNGSVTINPHYLIPIAIYGTNIL